jgi:hypothetical protein
MQGKPRRSDHGAPTGTLKLRKCKECQVRNGALHQFYNALAKYGFLQAGGGPCRASEGYTAGCQENPTHG